MEEILKIIPSYEGLGCYKCESIAALAYKKYKLVGGVI